MAETVTDVADKKLYIKFPQRVPPEEEVKELSPYIVCVSYPRQKSARFCHIVLESQSVVPEVLKQLNKKEYKNGHLRVEMPKKIKYIKKEQESHISEEKKTFKENRTGNIHKGNNKLSIGDGSSTMSGTEADHSTNFTAGKHVKRRSGKPATGGNNDRRLWITKLPFHTEDKELIATFPGCIWTKVYKSKATKSSRALCKFTTAQQAVAIAEDPTKHQFKGKEVVVILAKSQQLRGSGMKKKYGLNNENSVMDTEVQQLKTETKVENETATELKGSESNSDEAIDTEEEMSECGGDSVNSFNEDSD